MGDYIEARRKNTAGLANALLAKDAKGVLFQIQGYNSLAGTQFLQVHDAASAPADTAVPVLVIALAASAPFSLQFTIAPCEFQNGIYICNSTTGPTKTLGAANCLITALIQ